MQQNYFEWFIRLSRLVGVLVILLALSWLYGLLLYDDQLLTSLNSALAFLVAGGSVVAYTYQRHNLSAIGALLLLGMSILILVLDQSVTRVVPPSAPAPALAGWIPAAVPAFALMAFGMLALSRSNRTCCGYLAGGCASVLLILGGMGLMDYAVDLHMLYPWWPFSEMAVYAAIGQLLLGFGLLVLAHHRLASEVSNILAWAGLASVVGLLGLTLFLWDTLQRLEDRQIANLTAVQASRLGQFFEANLNERVNGIERMALRWEIAGGTPQHQWKADVQAYLHDMPGGYLGIRWLDPDGRIKWVYPPEQTVRLFDFDQSQEPVRRRGLERARRNHQPVFTEQFELLLGGQGMLLLRALYVNGQHDGYLAAAFRTDELLEFLAGALIERGYGIQVSCGGEALFQHGKRPPAGSHQQPFHDIHFESGGCDWQLKIWPTRQVLDEYQTALPTLTLISGLLLALLSGALFLFWERSRRRELEAQQAQAQVDRLFELLPEGVLMIDPETTLPVTFNATAHRQLGYSAAEFAQLPIEAYQEGESSEAIRRRLRDLTKIHYGDFEAVHRRKNGSLMQVHVTVLPFQENERCYLLTVYRDITEQKQAAQRLTIQSIAIEQSPTSVVITNRNGDIEYINQHFTEATGYTEDEVKGENPRILKSGLTPEATYRDMWQTLARGEDWSGELTNKRKNGEIYWEEAHISPVHDASGNVTHYVAVKMEITERKQAEEQLRALNASLESQVEQRTRELVLAKEEAEAASQAKSTFLSNMSHEIRTPMNSVLGMAYLALKANPTPKQRDYLQKILHSGEHLLGIINDILDFSKIEAGMLSIEPRQFNFGLIREDLDSMFAERLVEKGLRFGIHSDPAIPQQVKGDLLRLKQVLINLIGNAMKFTEEGAVSVKIRLLEEQDKQLLLRFEVHDTGIGMTEEQITNLFQAFHQANATITRKYGGTGLGLAICRQLVELMGGQIGVESEYGQGSTFWFVVPLGKVSQQEGELEEHDDGNPFSILNGASVLLAEDNPFNQQVATEMLERVGVAVTLANNGIEALDWLRKSHFDCVLMDMQMPEMDGLEATRQLRADPQIAAICVVAMTANASADDRAACFEAGMDAFVTKPVNPAEMYTVVARCLRKQSVASKLEEAPQDAVTTPAPSDEMVIEYSLASDPDVIDLLVLAERLGGEPDDVRRFAFKFLEAAQQGLEEMDTALDEQAAATLAALGHRIKSSARTVGAMKFADLCQSLEPLKQGGSVEQAGKTVAQLHSLLEVISAHVHNAFSNHQPLPSDAHSDSQALQVLVLDDEVFQFEFIQNTLKKLHITHLTHALDGVQGLAMLDEPGTNPDIIICDLDMPGMDGIEFMRNIAMRHYQGGIILLSGADASVLKVAQRLADIHNLNLLGAFEKPITRQALSVAISHLKSGGKSSRSRTMDDELPGVDALRVALQEGQIEAWFQPKVAVKIRKLKGVECLARWRHPEHGMINPGHFIPLAEEHGLIDELTFVMVRQAARQLGEWLRQGHELTASINVSMDSLNRLDLPELFDKMVREAGVQPKDIMLELTESRLMDNFTISLDIIARLRLKGFGLSIDDFGTGFSTLENLKQLPFTELKVDRAFVQGASEDAEAHAILVSSVELGRTFNLSIVAEGVETQADWDLVARTGCNEVQGYFIAKPMPAGEFGRWIGEWQQNH